MAEQKDSSFLGTGWQFPPAFSPHSGAAVAEGVEDVRQSLEILLSTRVGERLLEPRYGCDLTRFIFEPLDTTLATYVKELVRNAILYYEPRVKLESVDLYVHPDEGRLDILLSYLIAATNERANLVFPFYTVEGSATALGSGRGPDSVAA